MRINKFKDYDYDAIIIGSGIGGLTVASILAQMNKKRVLVLEKHFALGGQTHTFSRKGERKYSWDVGLHYVSGLLEKGEMSRVIFDYITGGELKWNRILEPYDTFVYPDFTFPVPDDETEYKNSIIELFPQERKAIEKYFKDIKKMARWSMFWSMNTYSPKYISSFVNAINSFSTKMALSTTAEYMDKTFKDPKLKALLCTQIFCLGLFPDEIAFNMHASMVNGFLKGACQRSVKNLQCRKYRLQETDERADFSINNFTCYS